MTQFAPLLEAYFTDRLTRQRDASPHTIASYRDAFCLLLRFVNEETGKAPSKLELGDLDASVIGAFLDHLERNRGSSVATRNIRLAALRSFFSYAALSCPEHANLISRVLAIPPKRSERTIVSYLDEAEVDALVRAPDLSTWIGRRDHCLLVVGFGTGFRVSELTRLRCEDVQLGSGAHLWCHGKGRKQRCVPIGKSTAAVLTAWMKECHGEPSDPVFPSRVGGALSRDAIGYLVTKHTAAGAENCPSLRGKNVTPHTLRHTRAMTLLQSGADIATIALWLGHESLDSTGIYVHADMTLKEKALARTAPLNTKPGRFSPSDKLLAFLESL
jgi:site-specific recombinase XerD